MYSVIVTDDSTTTIHHCADLQDAMTWLEIFELVGFSCFLTMKVN